MSKADTKQALLDTGMKLIYQQGYNATGLNEVLDTAGIPKGSFYYYFESKEDFGLQALDTFVRMASARLTGYLNDEAVDPLTRLHHYFDWYTGFLKDVGCTRGCMIGNMGQELADQNETFRRRIDEVMTRFSGDLARCLRAAQEQGQINAALDVEELAEFCYNSWQGALLRVKVTKSLDPILTFQNMLFDVILKP